MGLFRKEQKVHFKRDEYGRVVGMEKTGDRMGESRTPVSDALLKQQPKTKKKPSRLIQVGKAIDKKVVAWNKSRGSSYSTNNNYNPFGSMFDKGVDDVPKQKTRYIIKGGKAYPVAGSGKKKTKKKKSSSGFDLDFDMFDNWGLFK